MAFNPFHSMRKNSKAILAVLTIFIMVIFVLSSGIAGGDFFNDFVPRLLGGKNKNPTYAEAFGSSIRAASVDNTVKARLVANQFMLNARILANSRAMRRVNQQLSTPKELNEQTVEILRPIVNDRVTMTDPSKESDALRQISERSYNLFSMALAAPEILDRTNPQVQQALQQANNFLAYRQSLAKDGSRKDYEAMLTVENIVRYEGRQVRNAQPYFYVFSANRGSGLEDAMVFELFLKKADELGIHYPTNIINELIQRDMFHSLDPADAARVEQEMRRGGRYFTSEEIIKAIGDEFRVRAVVNLYLYGSAPGDRTAEVTPNAFFDFYKDNRTEMTLNLVEIPTSMFVPKVTGEPTPEELKKLYDQFKTQEYSLSSETPGFREMPKLKVEWIATKANLPYYEQNAKVIDGLTQLAAGFVPPLGTMPASGIAQVAAPHLWESLKMQEVYEGIVSRYNTEQTWDKGYLGDLHDTSKLSPHTLASVVGQIGLAHDPVNAMIHAPLTESVFNHVARTVETRARVAIGMPFVLAGYSPAAYNLFPALGPTAAAIPRMPSLEAYTKQLRDDLRQGAITRLFQRDVDTFKAELKKIRTEKKDGRDKKIDDIRKEVDAYVQQFVKDRGLQYGKSQDFRDRYTLPTDPGLKPLVDREPPPLSPVIPSSWIRAFFATLPQNATPNTPGVLFEPHWFPPREADPRLVQQFGPQILEFFDTPPTSPNELGYLAWRSDYTPAKTWQKYEQAPEEVKQKVVEAWKLQKARELAKAEAERLAAEFRTLAKAELQEKSNAPAFLNAVREKTAAYQKIELTKVAPLIEHESVSPLIAREYVEYTLPTKDIYFPGNMRNELLELRKKPLGETVIVTDLPKNNYYITTMVDKKEPTFGEFASTVFAKSATKAEVDPLYIRFVDQVTRGILFTVIDRLKIEANYKPTEEYIKLTTKKDTTDEE